MLPELSIVPSAIRPLDAKPLTKRVRAVEVGAGIGRVTSSVLLHLVHDVVLLEPVEHFVKEALARVVADTHAKGEWKGVKDGTKSVTVVQGTLQAFDPRIPISEQDQCAILGKAGFSDNESPEQTPAAGFDVIWCQWCLGHLSDDELVAFFRRSKEALRSPGKGTSELDGLIVVKENLCSEAISGEPRTVFDASDSSLTR